MRIIDGERAAAIARHFNSRDVEGPGGNGWEEGGYICRMLRNLTSKGEARYRLREFVEPKTRRKSSHAVEGSKSTAHIRAPEEWITFEVLRSLPTPSGKPSSHASASGACRSGKRRAISSPAESRQPAAPPSTATATVAILGISAAGASTVKRGNMRTADTANFRRSPSRTRSGRE